MRTTRSATTTLWGGCLRREAEEIRRGPRQLPEVRPGDDVHGGWRQIRAVAADAQGASSRAFLRKEAERRRGFPALDPTLELMFTS